MYEGDINLKPKRVKYRPSYSMLAGELLCSDFF